MWRNAASLASKIRAAAADVQQFRRGYFSSSRRAESGAVVVGNEGRAVVDPFSPGFPAAATHGMAGLQPWRMLQVRQVMVDVKDNNIESALRKLKRKLREDNCINMLRDRTHHIKPAEQRVLNRKARDTRVAKKEFRFKLRWIMERRSRGF